jgi:hypothetical protein
MEKQDEGALDVMVRATEAYLLKLREAADAPETHTSHEVREAFERLFYVWQDVEARLPEDGS